MADRKNVNTAVRATSVDFGRDGVASSSQTPMTPISHGQPEFVEASSEPGRKRKQSWRGKFAFIKTKEFWTILILGQVLALCITGTNTLSTLLAAEGTSIPAFQTFFNYVLLNLIYTTWTIYKYGFKKWGQLLLKDGWKCEYSKDMETKEPH